MNGTTVGSTATYECYVGFVLADGDEIRTCVDGGYWSGVEPVCNRKCIESLVVQLIGSHPTLFNSITACKDLYKNLRTPVTAFTVPNTIAYTTLVCLNGSSVNVVTVCFFYLQRLIAVLLMVSPMGLWN